MLIPGSQRRLRANTKTSAKTDTVEPLIILSALLAGIGFRNIGYPPLPGYLLAGFACSALGLGDVDTIRAIADVGITLLLFTIGLKLNLRDLAAPQVWGVAGLQIIVVVPLTALAIVIFGLVFPSLALADPVSAWTLALALSFSSTVFAVKMFEERGETASPHATIAIGILVLQDLVAVIYLVFSAEVLPSIWAFALLGLPLLRPLLLYILRAAGHGELVALFGMAMALGTAQLFDLVHLKAGLGALVMGVIFAGSGKSKELYTSLMSFKDLFLIGFFLQIGYYGLPSAPMIAVAVGLSLLLVLRPLIYYLLFVAFRLRARTALLTSASLSNYSEFGLIVAAIATSMALLPSEWLTTLALAVSISFFIATPVNTNIHAIYSRYRSLLHRFERRERLPQEIQAELGDADIMILGMGRVGKGAFDFMSEKFAGNLIGVEENHVKVAELAAMGVNCVQGDATDSDFWEYAEVGRRRLILVCLTNHSENVTVVHLSRAAGYEGQLAVVSRYADEQAELEALGCISFNLYAEAGHGFAEHVVEQVADTQLP